ncbi:MAG: urease subunit alpha [Flavobacteriaceae bacterium]|nr:urease subunit alpha [Flavobacteriaceae bacterium]
MKNKISRKEYAHYFGPTKGDKIRLANTNLWVEIEKDYTVYGEEVVFGGGKVIRDGMGQHPTALKDQVMDLVITNITVIDYTGIYKADIGIKDGKIANIGKAGNPFTQEGVTMTIGVGTEIIAGQNRIMTAGCIDPHVHFICPQQYEIGLALGTTTLIGGGSGPQEGGLATTCMSGVWHTQNMAQSTDHLPINFVMLARANSSSKLAIKEIVEAGCGGLKIHEDWGSTRNVLDTAMKVADDEDIQVCIHTDTLNEGLYVEDSLDAFEGRTIHTYHSEGAGGGHAPDLCVVTRFNNILPSSTTPTNPFTINTMDEHMDMICTCHHLDKEIPEDYAFAESRIRRGTMMAEGVLQDMGAISMMSSDSQAMGRIGEVVIRTWQIADKMKKDRGPLPQDKNNDNFRVKRYVSKYTINPAITHGISEHVGSIEVGKMADLIIYTPNMFGVKPHMVLKGGFPVYSAMGDPSASIPTPQPIIYRPSWGNFGETVGQTSALFVAQSAIDKGELKELGIKKQLLPVKNTRNLKKTNMIFNAAMPEVKVDPKTYIVSIDGEEIDIKPSDKLPLTQLYHLG